MLRATCACCGAQGYAFNGCRTCESAYSERMSREFEASGMSAHIDCETEEIKLSYWSEMMVFLRHPSAWMPCPLHETAGQRLRKIESFHYEFERNLWHGSPEMAAYLESERQKFYGDLLEMGAPR